MISWVIGRGGLLGRNVELALATKGAVWHPNFRFTWNDDTAVEQELFSSCRDFATAVDGTPWQIAWCAGAGFVGSDSSDLERETLTFSRLLTAIDACFDRREKQAGAFFFASSAGGVYAGSRAAPFGEDSPVAPLAPYGWNKLEQEHLALRWSEETAIALLVGRLSNLYGPGQNLTKFQGLISQMCLRVLVRQPLVLYVPLDTIRDYLFAKDAGRLVAEGLTRLRLEATQSAKTPAVVKVLASQHGATVATVLAQLRWIAKRPLSVIVAPSLTADRQARDLRLISSVWPELDQQPLTTLSEGMQSVLMGILATAREGRIGIDASPFD